MEWRKSEGIDGIMVEMVESLGEFEIDKITHIANKIKFTGTIRQRMKEFKVRPKRVGVVDCIKH